MTALLDTHILLWWLEDRGRLSEAQEAIIDDSIEGAPVLVSDISLWEAAMLENLGRIKLALPLREWLEAAVAPPRVQRQGVTPAIAAGSRCATRVVPSRSRGPHPGGHRAGTRRLIGHQRSTDRRLGFGAGDWVVLSRRQARRYGSTDENSSACCCLRSVNGSRYSPVQQAVQ